MHVDTYSYTYSYIFIRLHITVHCDSWVLWGGEIFEDRPAPIAPGWSLGGLWLGDTGRLEFQREGIVGLGTVVRQEHWRMGPRKSKDRWGPWSLEWSSGVWTSTGRGDGATHIGHNVLETRLAVLVKKLHSPGGLSRKFYESLASGDRRFYFLLRGGGILGPIIKIILEFEKQLETHYFE